MGKDQLFMFVIFWLWIAGMALLFLWAVREIWRRYLKPILDAALNYDEPHLVPEHAPGSPTELEREE